MAIATSGNPRISNPSIDGKALAEQVNLLFVHSRGVHIATIGVIVLLLALFRDVAHPRFAMSWAITFIGVEFLRLVAAVHFQSTVVPAGRVSRWLKIFQAGNVLSATGWGLAGVLLFPAGAVVHQVLLAAVLVGAAAIAVPILATEFRSYLVFTLLATGPMSVMLLLQQTPVAMIAGVATLAIAGLLTAVASRMHSDIMEAFHTRFAFADMAEEFDAEVTTRINAEDTLRRGERRGRKQSYVLLDLAKEDAIASGDLPRALHVVTEKAAQAIRCTRVSVWFSETEFTEFRCVHLYDNGYHDTTPGIRLGTGPQSGLFRRLGRMRTFAVNDARHDKRMRPFALNYLEPYRVSAALGAPFRQGGKVRGVIVMEHVGLPRTWTRDERMFASSLSDFLSLALAASGRQQAQEQLRHLANFDRLTALPNRAMFHDRLSHALTKAQRSSREIALLFVDVDRFKSINDSLGHGTGDRVLRSIAKRLMRCVRKSDTVARLGGDEFTVILDDLDGLDTVISVCERILETVAEPLVFAENEVALTCSIGIAHYPNDGSDAEVLLQNADTAMYRAKKGGRNQYQFFTPDMHEQAMERLERESDLRKALQRNEFTVVYQPQVDTATGETVCLEALVRWQHPVKGLVMPQDFIPLAEETGLIPQLGEWVLREACRQAQVWRAQYHDGFHIAVNLSVGQFILRNVPELVSGILDETGLPASALLLEITESLAVGEGTSTLALLQDLKKLGCRLALDDFGTGNSSLSYLKRFPVDIIKIDRSFIRDLRLDAHDAAIAKATIGLARSLNLQVVAEGVENEAQMQWLRDEGCNVMQGYLFSPPLFADECGDWLMQRTPVPERAMTPRETAEQA
ncbi:MAG TPA: EAL domain-containing protein [Gammaproteobacteria bacterium]